MQVMVGSLEGDGLLKGIVQGQLFGIQWMWEVEATNFKLQYCVWGVGS